LVWRRSAKSRNWPGDMSRHVPFSASFEPNPAALAI
jgi:hypothetical protein